MGGEVIECEVAIELLSRVGGWESVAKTSGRLALTEVDSGIFAIGGGPPIIWVGGP